MSLEIKSIVVVLNDNLIDFLNYLEDNTEYIWNCGSKPKDFTPRGGNILVLKTGTKIIQSTVRNLEQFKIDILDGVNTNEYVIISTVKELDFILNGNITIDYNKPKQLVYESVSKIEKIVCDTTDKVECQKMVDYLIKNGYVWEDEWGDGSSSNIYANKILIFNLDDKTIFGVDNEYWDLKKTFKFYDAGVCKIVNSLNELINILHIDYNKPNNLVYEMYNEIDNSSKISVKVSNKEELNELNDFLIKFDLNDYDINRFSDMSDGFPFLVFFYLKGKSTSFITKQQLIEFDVENVDFSTLSWLNGVYNHVFDYGREKPIIHDILKDKKIIRTIDYNKPRQLVYENNINEMKSDEDVNEIGVRITNMEELTKLSDLWISLGYTDDVIGLSEDVDFSDKRPLYIFLGYKNNFTSIFYNNCDESDPEFIDVENYGFVYINCFKESCERIFDINKDYVEIKNILISKKINIFIDYNKPKQLVYESLQEDYKHIVCKVKDDEESKKIQEMTFEFGYRWYGNSTNVMLDINMDFLVLNTQRKNFDFTINGDGFGYEQICNHFHNDGCILINSYEELKKKLVRQIDYNKPKQLVYDIVDNKPEFFKSTHYRLPNFKELVDINSYNLNSKEILNGFTYNCVGRGIMSKGNVDKIIKSVEVLSSLFPENNEYKIALEESKKIKSR